MSTEQLIDYQSSEYCYSSDPSNEVTCYNMCCCYTYDDTPYCCTCSQDFIFYWVIFVVCFILIAVVAVVLVRRAKARRIAQQQAGYGNYYPVNVPPVYNNYQNPQSNNQFIPVNNQIPQNFNQVNYPNNYQNVPPLNQIYVAQNSYQPNNYRAENNQSIYMGQPINQSIQTDRGYPYS